MDKQREDALALIIGAKQYIVITATECDNTDGEDFDQPIMYESLTNDSIAAYGLLKYGIHHWKSQLPKNT